MKLFSRVKIKTRLILAFSVMLLLILFISGFAAILIFNVETMIPQNPAGTLAWITAAAIFIALFMMASLTGSIVKPIAALADAARDVNNGDLNVHFKTDSGDELGELKKAFGMMTDTFNSLTNDLEFMAVAQSEGVTGIRVDAKKYKGTYSDLAVLVNDMVTEHNDITNTAISTVLAIASGEFDAQAPAFPGDKAILNDTIELLRKNIETIYSEMSVLVREASGGKLGSRADGSKFGGGWRGLVTELNALMDAMTEPVNETIVVLERIAAGDLETRMSGNYEGDFKKIKECVNFMAHEISGYISEISAVLAALSGGDFKGVIGREYIGDFVRLKDSINQIIDNLNKDFGAIQFMAEQFSSSAIQLSGASVRLAQGATEQNESVNSLSKIISDYRMISENIAGNAKMADKMLRDIDREARDGNSEMSRLMSAIADISVSSANIASINKVVEDIAFRTNLLAINASVEAARAGEHGKGFGIVADEVRGLANRSGLASKETEHVINASAINVQTGSQISDNVSVMLKRVSERITDALSVVAEIASVSGRQTERNDLSADINSNTEEIIKVTMETASASQQTAATSQELASQAEILQQTLARYRLRDAKVIPSA